MSGVSYGAVSASETTLSAYGVIGNSSFSVDPTALPEFPTAAVGPFVLAACFAIYYWRRRNTVSLREVRR